jgi:hypothetical protein
MIAVSDLLANADERLSDAECLHADKKFAGAVYLSGYVIELALKARICRTLKWSSFPQTKSEFQDLQCFKVHNLNALLRLSGIDERIRSRFAKHWRVVSEWSPELRYRPAGSTTDIDSSGMIRSTRILLRAIT